MNKKDKDLLDAFNKNPSDPEIKWQVAQEVMTDETLNELLDASMKAVRETTKADRPKKFEPFVAITGRSSKGGHEWETVIATPQEVGEDREELFRALGEEIAEARPDFYPVALHFASEAWTSHYDKKPKKYTRPSEDPNRKEQVVVMGLTIDGRVTMAADEITRLKDGTIKLKPSLYHPYVKGQDEEAEAPNLRGFFSGLGDTHVGLKDVRKSPHGFDKATQTRMRKQIDDLEKAIGGKEGAELKKRLLDVMERLEGKIND